jgi:hypothetical protein
MRVADIALDRDHTLTLFCEADQTATVDAMFAEVERLRERVAELEAAARLALNSMELLVTNFICDATHHAKADQHQWADCPIEVRFASAKEKLRAALKETK